MGNSVPSALSALGVNEPHSMQQLEKFQCHSKMYRLQVVEQNGIKLLEARFILNPKTWFGVLFHRDSYRLKAVTQLISNMHFQANSVSNLRCLYTTLQEKVAHHNRKKPNDIPDAWIASLQGLVALPDPRRPEAPLLPPSSQAPSAPIPTQEQKPPSLHPQEQQILRIMQWLDSSHKNLENIKADAATVIAHEQELKSLVANMVSGSKVPAKPYERALTSNAFSKFRCKSAEFSVLKYLLLTDQIGYFQEGRTGYLFGIDPTIMEGRQDEDIEGAMIIWNCCLTKDLLLKLDKKAEEFKAKYLSILSDAPNFSSLNKKVLLDLLQQITDTITRVEPCMGSPRNFDWQRARVGSIMAISKEGERMEEYFAFFVKHGLLHAWRYQETRIEYAVYADGLKEYDQHLCDKNTLSWKTAN